MQLQIDRQVDASKVVIFQVHIASSQNMKDIWHIFRVGVDAREAASSIANEVVLDMCMRSLKYSEGDVSFVQDRCQ